MAMKVTNWTQGMIELQEYVVGDCYCLWDLFLENVENEGWTLERLTVEADKCVGDRKALRKLVGQFI